MTDDPNDYSDENLLSRKISDLEQSMIADAFHKLDGNIAHTARALGVSRANLYRKLKLYGLYPRKTGILMPQNQIVKRKSKNDFRSE